MNRFLLTVSLLCLGCAHGEPDIATLASSSDQIIWEAGMKAFEKRQWEGARQHFRRIIDGFPQSEYGPAARLALADSHFQEGGTAAYILAVSEYRDFLTLYPSHPRSDYAQFHVAESYFQQRNGPDRDQTPTTKALDEYQRLIALYPASTYADRARARIAECRNSLARSEFLAGYFYQRTRERCPAAIARYSGVLADYPDYSRLDEVLYRLGECLLLSGRAAEARPQLARLLSEFPQSEYADDARRLLSAPAAGNGAGPTPTPSP